MTKWISRASVMRIIDAEPFYSDVINEKTYMAEQINNLPTKEDRWFSIDEVKPEPHEDVLVRGVEMFSGKEITAVKQFDVDTFRPVSAPSVVWKEWHKIPK